MLAAMLGLLGNKSFHVFFELGVLNLVGVAFHRADKKALPLGKEHAEANEIGAAKDVVFRRLGICRAELVIAEVPFRGAHLGRWHLLVPAGWVFLIKEA